MTSTVRDPLTREAVLAATRTLIIADGLDKLSLRRVARELGVTAPALYAYMADKRDLLRAVAESAFDELVEQFEVVDDPDPLERIAAYSRIYIRYALANPELFRTMFIFPPELALSSPTGEELPAATRAFDRPREAVEAAIAAGLLRDVDPLIASLTLWTATHGAADVLLMGFGFDEAGTELLVDSVVTTVVNGLRA
ncbi:MAG: TetR/AcrR family transcriptional regulator [Acidimicrobiia bacterium]|nr:TetR/AcrR family transcriptional regulator [Acidimicrobiia bacterium]